jgi:hypothetical protein
MAVTPTMTAAAPTEKQPHVGSGAEPAALEAPQADPKPAAADPLAPKFSALARQQKAIRASQLALEKERASWKAEQEAQRSSFIPKSRFQEDALGALEEAGLTYDQLTQLALSSPNSTDPTIRELQRELKAVKEAQEKANSQLSDSQKSQDEQAKKLILNEVKVLVDGNDDFETIGAMNAHESVVELIEAVLEDQGILMDVSDAAKEIEEYLFEEQAMKIAKLKKIQSKFAPQPQAPAEPQKQAPTQKPQLQTLSNRISDGAPKPLSDRERRERAILAFKGQLS